MTETTSPPPPIGTPKRKRDDLITDMRLSASFDPRCAAKTTFSFQPPRLQPTIPSDYAAEDGNNSPRSKVAQKFRDLAIQESGEGPNDTTGGREPESGGGAAAAAQTPCWLGRQVAARPGITRFNFDAGTTAVQPEMQLDPEDDDTTVSRKRSKTTEPDASNPEPAANSLAGGTNAPKDQTLSVDDPTSDHLSVAVDPNITSALRGGIPGSLQKSYPSINRLADSRSRGRRRVGTPPLSSRRKANNQAQSQSVKEEGEEEEPSIVDPVRAALTWREDEITVYDPQDKDDDGTGINGIGFKPTAAVAYQRAQKRRQQLAEYRKREESEARARRNQRRRGLPGGGAELTRKHSIVRVHFSDAPPTTVMTT